MKLRLTAWIAAFILLLAAGGMIGWFWLVHTEGGANWLFSKLQAAVPGKLEASVLDGDLASGLELRQLRFSDDDLRLDVARVSLAVDIDLFPPLLRLEELRADRPVLQMFQVSGDATDWNTILPGLIPPVAIEFPDVAVSDFEIIADSGDPVLALESVEAAGSLHRALILDRFMVRTAEDRLEVAGRLDLLSPHTVSAGIRTSGRSTIQANLSGNSASLGLELASELPEFSARGTINDLLGTIGWDLKLASPSLSWPIDDPDPDFMLEGVEALSSGTWPDYQLELSSQFEWENLGPSRLELDGVGTAESFTARKLSLEGSELALEAAGEASWNERLLAELDATLIRLDPGAWLDEWPEGRVLEGEISAAWSENALLVPNFVLNLRGSPASMGGEATFDPDAGVVDANLKWHDLQWPPAAETPDYISDSGSVWVSGRPEDWKLDGSMGFQAGGLPRGELQLSGSGDLDSLAVNLHEGSIMGGLVSGEFIWNWTGRQPFSARLNARELNISPLAAQFPGLLSADLVARGELEPLKLEVLLQSAEGELRTQPFQARGALHVQGEIWRAEQLTVTLGPSSITLDGNPYHHGGIAFSADIHSLADLSAHLDGSLSGRGVVSLHSESPHFSANISGANLAWGDSSARQLQLRDRMENGRRVGTDLELTGLVLGERPVDFVRAGFGGNRPLQEISFESQAQGTSISLALRGSVRDWKNPVDSGWSGFLSSLNLEHQDRFGLELDDSTSLEFSPRFITLDPACLSGTGGASVCIKSSWHRDQGKDLAVTLASLPLGLLEQFIDTDLEFSQILSGHLNWSQARGGRFSGDARIEMSPGKIRVEDDDELVVHTGKGLFDFELAEGQLTDGDLDIGFGEGGSMDIDFSVPNLAAGLDSPVTGSARIKLDDVGKIGRIFPLIDGIGGSLDVDMMLAGTLSDPAFIGSAKLEDGRIVERATGLSITEINLSGSVSETDESVLKGSFRTGEGTGEVAATIEFEDILSPSVTLQLQGESLTLIDVPDLNVIANPDLDLAWQKGLVEINGRLHIPKARISPSYLPQNSARQSEDVVIVAGELPEDEPDFLKDQAIRLTGTLELVLGEEVRVELDMAQARVTGTARFDWDQDLIPTANGNYNVTGEIQAYGQLLRVTRGRISFPDIPADNPHLNIRAEREIFGNSQIRRAGLMVAGTLQRPIIEAYTVPMTNKHRAQTLLVTGSDFDFERGVGAVDVGTYILPRLYVSYGIGVFEEGNVVSARFDLGRGFGIKATSGERETGLDLNYRFER